jgi:glutamate-1-semialdehyde 2,1-aminomutase
MWTSFFTSEPVVDWDTANRADRKRFGLFFHEMLDEGVYLAPSQFEAGFVSTAHSAEIIERTIEAARKAFGKLGGTTAE